MSAQKELRFFADRPKLDSGPLLDDPTDRSLVQLRPGNWHRGLDWYQRPFDSTAMVRGESSPIYTSPWFAYCAERIAILIPDVKLIYCVRDPIERTVSLYRFMRAFGMESRPVDEALTPSGYYASVGRLALRLEPYLAEFDGDRILIVELEDLTSRRRQVLRSAFQFLGVDDGFWASDLERSWDPARTGPPRSMLYPLRRIPGARRLRQRMPSWGARWMYRPTRRDAEADPLTEPSPEVRERLAAAFVEDASRLRSLTGRAFRSWSV